MFGESNNDVMKKLFAISTPLIVLVNAKSIQICPVAFYCTFIIAGICNVKLTYQTCIIELSKYINISGCDLTLVLVRS